MGAVRTKIASLVAISVATVGFHYGWLDRFFGGVHWLHAVHGRLCYVPIMMAAAWFGLRGGLYAAAAISVLVTPNVVRAASDSHEFAIEVAEVVFYFAFAMLVGVLVDRENAERHRRELAQREADRSQKLSLAGQIAAGVAHEIKNPLASIKGASDILVDDNSSHDVREEFKQILQNEVRRIDSTVTQFLEFARPRETRLQSMNLSEAIHTSALQVAATTTNGVSITEDISEGIYINGDTEKIHQLTLNLLLNAVHASESGDEVNVSVQRKGSMARLRVTDHGSGIAEENIEHIFEPFFTGRPDGTGLGLAVVKEIVADHYGDVSAITELGQGTTFVVEFPAINGPKR